MWEVTERSIQSRHLPPTTVAVPTALLDSARALEPGGDHCRKDLLGEEGVEVASRMIALKT